MPEDCRVRSPGPNNPDIEKQIREEARRVDTSGTTRPHTRLRVGVRAFAGRYGRPHTTDRKPGKNANAAQPRQHAKERNAPDRRRDFAAGCVF
ncbi:protein of unknown function [Paraburkholderia kururiensis]